MKLDPLGGESALEKIGDFEIETEGDAREEFEDGDLGAEAIPDRAELETDRARADNQEFFRRFIEAERLSAAHDRDAVEGHAREIDRHAAGCDDDVIAGNLGRVAFVRLNAHLARRGDGAESGEGGDFVALHQRAYAAGESFHDFVLATEHGGEIETDFVEDDAVFGRFLFRENKMVARGEKRLARDAADVEAGAAFSMMAVLSPSCAARMAAT